MNEQLINYRPSNVSPPGETLADILDERGMTQAELAERTGRPIKTINEIIKGKSAITSETAIQFERVLGVPAEFWNQREANYRGYLAREKEVDSLKDYKAWIKKFPLKEMANRGWINKLESSTTDQMIQILNYFGVASPEQWEAGWTQRRLAFRKAVNINVDLGAISIWLRQGEIEAEKIQCKPFNKEKLVEALQDIRALTKEREPSVFIPRLIEICADCGVAVVFVKPFPKGGVHGSSSWLNSDKALIQLSVRGKSADTLWFTIFHELGHILKHSKKQLFVELDKDVKNKSPEEVEADAFASETLIPESKLNQWLNQIGTPTQFNILAFADEQGIASGIVVGRLQFLKHIPYSSFNGLKYKYEWKN